MPSHTQDLETQDRLTKNIKDLLWLNTYADGKDIKAGDALAALEVCTCTLAAISRLVPPSRFPFPRSLPSALLVIFSGLPLVSAAKVRIYIWVLGRQQSQCSSR